MPSNSLHKIVQNRDTIRKIMAMDSNGSMTKMVKEAVSNGSLSYDEGGATFNMPAATNGKQSPIPTINEEFMQNSKMPRIILESFQKNPGIDDTNSTMSGFSVLDSLGIEKLNEIKQERNTENNVNEVRQTAGPIDYSLLRTIINEAVQENVKKYMSALSKKLISEGISLGGSDSIQAIKIGDKVSVITNKGDVYEAVLKYKTSLDINGDKKSKKK